MPVRKMRVLVIVGLLLLSCAAGYAQQGLKGEYFGNMTLSGQPVLTRTENVAFNWAGGAPGPGVAADSFSVRWTGSITPVETADYTFATRSDDGVRLFLDGDAIINNWGDHSATMNHSAPVRLEAGVPVGIRMEFYENGGDAVAELYWSSATIPEQIIPIDYLSPTLVLSVTARKPKPANGAVGVIAPLLEWTPAESAIFHDVYLATSPDLTQADLVAPRQYITLYYHVPGLTPGTTYYWRIDEIEKDGVTTHTGSVWSFTMQALTAYLPNPTDASVGASANPMLTWLPGADAVKHQVYFGDSLEAVTQGAAATDKGTRAVTDANYAPGALESMTTYYWRVDELLSDGTVKTGAVWSFTTCLPVDDFEDYTDDEGSRIYETWVDGWTNGTGSQVGYTNAPFAEYQAIHSGRVSMPFDYNNANAPFYSEVEREFATAQDWTFGGADTLVLYVRGRAGNGAVPLYFAVEDASKKVGVVAHPSTMVAATAKWTEWQIPLSDFAGVSLTRVKKIYLGLGDRANPAKGGAGLIFVDDIRVIKAPTAQ